MKSYKFVKRLLGEEAGQSFVIVALSVVVLFGATGVAVDIGNVYLQKTKLQTAADAGALAGAQVMARDMEQATPPSQATVYSDGQTMASKIATQNIGNATYDPSANGNQLTVVAHESVPAFFTRIFGVNHISVAASSTAEYGPISSDNGAVPIAAQYPVVQGKSPGDQILLTVDQTGGPGNWGYLSLNPPTSCPMNGSPTDQSMACGSSQTINFGDSVPTSPGEQVSQLSKAIDYRNSHGMGDVLIPLVSSFPNGKKDVQIIGFIEIGNLEYVDNGDMHGITGVILGTPVLAPIVPSSSSSGYEGSYSVALVK